MKLLVQTLVFLCCNIHGRDVKDHNNMTILIDVVLCLHLSINMAPLSLATNMTGYISVFTLFVKILICLAVDLSFFR